MTSIKVEFENGVAHIFTPYNQDFVSKIKRIGGAKWNASLKCWTVPEETVDVVRDIMIDIYGYSDISGNETVTLKVFTNCKLTGYRKDVVLFGKTLAHAWGRDSGAKVGDDVAYIKGTPTSGGSMKNWESVVPADCEIMLYNVSKTLWDNFGGSENVEVTLVDSGINEKALIEEKERLLKRIEEIESLLGEKV